ncbi:hypothetical protein M446_4571 [Methylobacterium sp. 4-46]|uniref:DUF2735 domain-containing protein n=1 Tax=unclassified Methylobacterium TaxID=2615210 RepID=UPI000165CE1E|nr:MULTISPECIES: DUF2735 domain-containing protein [Methylobacterium]ACA18912.1 hypothetical protein M446_4571 [Methylobacterium sp. 4-46]WFT78134.1 DUF2735 domain-containing protein [Methylobacterium nodulans]
MMKAGPQRETAKIYQFPLRNRAAPAARRPQAEAGERATRYADAAFGAGWYHEAAIQDADRSRKP